MSLTSAISRAFSSYALTVFSLQLVVVVYVIVVMWLVSSNFRSAAASAAKASKKTASLSRCLVGQLGSRLQRLRLMRGDDVYGDYGCEEEDDEDDVGEVDEDGVYYEDGFGGGLILEDEDEDDEDDEFLVDADTEALLVVQDSRGKKKPRSTTHFEEDYEGEPV